jgi:hypothetical protein
MRSIVAMDYSNWITRMRNTGDTFNPQHWPLVTKEEIDSFVRSSLDSDYRFGR